MYWVYENWTAEKKAVIHLSTCGSCDSGQGSHPNLHGDAHGCWHGPFETYAAALVAANGLKDRDVRACKRCCPA